MEIDACAPSTSNVMMVSSNPTVEKPEHHGMGMAQAAAACAGGGGGSHHHQSAKDPNFNYFAAGNETEKLKWLVLEHVKPTTLKRMFAPLMSQRRSGQINRNDELACVKACMLLRALEPMDNNKPAIELEQACYGLIGLLNTEKVHLQALDRIITRIIITAAKEKIISLLLACQLIVTSIDFRMHRYPNPEKIKFVRQCMDQMDYKNMRDLLKLLLVEKLDKMACQLNEFQHMQLAPIEELVIDMIDRRKNFCPALFFITEISRIDTDHSSIHFLPRISLKIREMVASFRPLAEIGCMLGRSWMWPVPASPIFSWSSQTWSAWKLDEKHCKLYFKTHLPYSSENSSPQTYLQYILFKQPHGQDNLNHILRSSNPQSPAPRLQCDEVIQLLILEAMCAMEDSEQPVLAPINQYNWLHLSHLVTYALSMGHCTLSQLLIMLLPQLKSCQYLRAKEELMWILLQYIAHAKSTEKRAHLQQQQQQQQQAQQQQQQQYGGQQQQQQQSAMISLPASGGLGAQNRELVLEIFNVLYTDKSMNWGDTCSTEQPLNMVRFFAPAAIWINLVSSPGAEQLPQPQPPEKLRTLIDFIEKQLHEDKEQQKSSQLEKNSALLAIVANAYSNHEKVFEEHVANTVFHMLGYQHQPQQPPPSAQLPAHPQPAAAAAPAEKWTLPGGRKTEPFLRALDLTFLDSLTFQAKRQLYNSALKLIQFQMQQQQQQMPQTQQQSNLRWKLPSPAFVESMARLLLSTELCDQNGQRFYMLVLQIFKLPTSSSSAEAAAKQQQQQQQSLTRNDFMTMFLELLNFRLQNICFGWKWDIFTRTNFFIFILEQMLNNLNSVQSPAPSSIQMCLLLQQTMLRFAQCTWPQDLLNTVANMYSKMEIILLKWHKNNPELYRAFLLCGLRAAKLLGDNQMHVIATELGWQWPRADLQWFPAGVQQILCEQLAQNEAAWAAEHGRQMMELEQASGQEMQHLVHLDAEHFMPSPSTGVYGSSGQVPALFISIFRCLYQFQMPNFQLPQPAKPPHSSAPNFFALCYKTLGSLGNRDLHRLTNAFVDWLAWKCAWLGQTESTTAAAAALGQDPDEYDLSHTLKVLNDMLFSHQFLSVERLLFSMVLHPSDDQSVRTLLYLLAALLDNGKMCQLADRLHACYAFAPAHSQTTGFNSEDFFVQMAEYYKKYPEYSVGELYWRTANPQQPEPSKEGLNLPVYYGHLGERICPLVDFLLQRALALEVKPAVLDTLLRHFSPIYRIHPQPMTFLYTTLYSLDDLLLAQHQQNQQQQQQQSKNNGSAGNSSNPNSASASLLAGRPVRKFVLEIVMKLEQQLEEETTAAPAGGGGAAATAHQTPLIGRLLSLEFIQQDHQMPAMKFCRVLVERIVQASTYTHQPPPFVHRDWRFAEFSPAAQALTSAWVELLASRHSPADIIDALLQLAIRRPISRPQDTLNALGLLLTGLPASFQGAFLDKVEESFDWDQLTRADADPAQLFESLSHEVYLHSESRILSMLALVHSFCQHGGNSSLNIVSDLINQRLTPKVQNEAQLLYFLRIVVPYLQRIHEKERSRHMTEIVKIYQVLGQLTQKVGSLRYEDTICDLLYQFKYMFVGYLLKEQTEQAIRSFPDSMQEKLKFLLTHSSNAAAAAAESQQQMLLQQQQILQHQSSQGSLFSGGIGGGGPIIHQQQQPTAGGGGGGGGPGSGPAGQMAANSSSMMMAAAQQQQQQQQQAQAAVAAQFGHQPHHQSMSMGSASAPPNAFDPTMASSMAMGMGGQQPQQITAASMMMLQPGAMPMPMPTATSGTAAAAAAGFQGNSPAATAGQMQQNIVAGAGGSSADASPMSLSSSFHPGMSHHHHHQLAPPPPYPQGILHQMPASAVAAAGQGSGMTPTSAAIPFSGPMPFPQQQHHHQQQQQQQMMMAAHGHVPSSSSSSYPQMLTPQQQQQQMNFAAAQLQQQAHMMQMSNRGSTAAAASAMMMGPQQQHTPQPMMPTTTSGGAAGMPNFPHSVGDNNQSGGGFQHHQGM